MALLDFGFARPTSHTAPRPTLFAFALRAIEARRQRAALKRLDDAALQDLGLTRRAAMEEASKPIWDVPKNWRD